MSSKCWWLKRWPDQCGSGSREGDHGEVDLRLLGDGHGARGEGRLTLVELPVFVLPERSRLLGVVGQLGQTLQQLPVQDLVAVLGQPVQGRSVGIGVGVDGHGQPGRVAGPVGAEVPGRGQVLEEVPAGQGLLRAAQGEHRDQAVLVEVVVGDDVGGAVEIGAAVEVAEGHLGRQVGLHARRARVAGPVGQGHHGPRVGRPVDDDVGPVGGLLVRLVAQRGGRHPADRTTSIPVEVKHPRSGL